MKWFLGGLVAGIVIFFTMTQAILAHGHKTTRAETEEWLHEVTPVQEMIAANLIQTKSPFYGGGPIPKSLFKADNIGLFNVDRMGNIYVEGGREWQMIVLEPQVVGEKIVWHCIGGSDNAMPAECRE